MDFVGAEKALVQRDAVGLCRELSALYPQDPGLDKLPDLVRFALVAGTAMPRLADPNSVFAASIAATNNFWLGPDMHAGRATR